MGLDPARGRPAALHTQEALRKLQANQEEKKHEINKNYITPRAADLARLRRAKTLPTRKGGVQEKVMEDIWLGSILYRYPLPTPVHYISLLGDRGSALYVDAWDFRMARTAVLIHIITKFYLDLF